MALFLSSTEQNKIPIPVVYNLQVRAVVLLWLMELFTRWMVVQLIFSVIMSDEDHDVDVESDVGVLIIYPFVVLYCVMPENGLQMR